MARTPKEAIVIILDIGENSSIQSGDKKSTFFDRAKNCVSRIIQRKIFGKPNDEVGLILMGTEDADNQLHSSIGGYENISEVIALATSSWQMLRWLDKEVQPTKQSADWIDALIVAMNFLKESVQAKKFSSLKIVLLSTLSRVANTDKMETIVAGLMSLECELNIINDNVEYAESYDSLHFHEHGIFSQYPMKSQEQRDNERQVMHIIDQTNGVLCNIDSAELLLIHFQKKSTRAMPWHCPLTIGSDLSINVSAFVHISEAKAVGSFKTETSEQNVSVKYTTQYFKGDKPIEPDLENLIKGYSYGSTIVPYDTEINMDYKSGPKCFTCVGFTDAANILDEYLIGDGAHVVLPQKGYQVSEKKFVALFNAMVNLNMWMIVRRVYRNDSRPGMVVLMPNQAHKFPCFTMLQLCFAEEVLTFNIPSLRTNKFKPSTEQYDAMDELIDAMDLMDAVDDNTNIKEAFPLNKTLNPIQQHIYQTIAHRALKPNEHIPAISEELLSLVEIPPIIKERSKENVTKVKELFPLEEVKTFAKKLWVLKNVKANSQAAVDDEVGDANNDAVSDRHLVEVGTVTPAEDFSLLLKRGEKFATLCTQIQIVISDLVFKSMTIQNVKVAMAIMMYREEAKLLGTYRYNEWIVDFKKSLMSRNKTEFWNDVILKERFGLITAEESEMSTVSNVEAEEFYSSSGRNRMGESNVDEGDDIDADDLFANM